MKKTLALIALAAAAAAFGEAVPYDPAVHGNPIVVTGDAVVEIDGGNETVDGGGTNRCATLGPNVTLKNFTFTNGKADLGGGVYGGRIVGCKVTGCTATESGAALCNCVAESCVIEGNTFDNGSSKAAAHGGILFGSTLKDCTVRDNAATFGSEAPAFGGIGEKVTVVGGLVTNNAVTCEKMICCGLRFAYSTIDGKYVKFDDGTSVSPDPGPGPGPGPDPQPVDPQPEADTFVPESDPEPLTGGVGMVGRYYRPLYLDQLNGALARTYGKRDTVKVEGLPAGLKLVKESVEGGYCYSITGVPTEPLDAVTRLAYVRVTDAAKNVTFLPLSALRILPATVAKFPDATKGTEYWKFPVASIWPDFVGHEKNWTFSGWPSGIKFASKETTYNKEKVALGRIYGKPTKVGVFTVKATEKIDGVSYKNTHTATFTVLYEDGEEPPSVQKPTPSATLELPDDRHVTVDTVTDLRAGVAYEWTMTNTALSTVSASGLPTGLKLASSNVTDKVTKKKTYFYRVTGVPTKAGYFLSTFTVKLNGVTSKSTVAFNVVALPDWAVGTFDGGADSTETSAGGQATFTVAKTNGKLSGKWLSEGTNWTLSATSYASYDWDTGTYFANVTRKTGSGKKAVSFVETLTVCASDAAELGGDAEHPLFLAWQNNWKVDPWKTLAKPFAKGGEIVYCPSAASGDVHTNDTVSLKFATSGKVTVKAKLVKSVSDKGKITWHSASGSAVLCPQTAPDASGAFNAVVFVYFPPKAKTPLAAGHVACVWVRWDGQAFGLLEQDK